MSALISLLLSCDQLIHEKISPTKKSARWPGNLSRFSHYSHLGGTSILSSSSDIRSYCVIDKRYTTAEEIVQMARESLPLAKEERKTQFFIHYFVRIPLLIIVIASSVRCTIIVTRPSLYIPMLLFSPH
jgi:hypothetical protein